MKNWVGELGLSYMLTALHVLRSRGFALTIFLVGGGMLSKTAIAAEDAKFLFEKSSKAYHERRYDDAARYLR